VFGSDLLTKQNSLQLYAYNTTNYGDPRIKQTFGMEFPCRQVVDSLTGKSTYHCGSNTLSEDEMNSIPTNYNTVPNTFLNERTPAFAYRSLDNRSLYLLNANSNETFIARLWFNDPTIQNYEEVFWKNKVKIFKVIK
jgi:hypothetical protein